jgi:zinc protease
MTPYHAYTLNNGLRIVVQPMPQSTMAVVNLMYLVGSRNESPHSTGMAHFLEHIMFGGSKHVADYDKTLQRVGGKNNAYTSNDVTSYWCKLPASQLEVAFWLESDRMLAPAYSDKTIETQRSVVTEEFKQCCINKPYGDVWHLLSAQAYKEHPYAWPTIGKRVEDIAAMKKEDIVAFGERYYTPDNAVLVVLGDVDPAEVYRLAEKWFGSIAGKKPTLPPLPQEPIQKEAVVEHHEGRVPQDVLYKTYHIPGRADDSYKTLSLLSAFLGDGDSSLFYEQLVEKEAIFSDVDVSTTSTMDPGLFILEGKLAPGVSYEKAERALGTLLQVAVTDKVGDRVLQKIKNQEEAAHLWSQANPNAYADLLAYATLLGDTSFFDKENKGIKGVSSEALQRCAAEVFAEENSHTLYYRRKE